ncbi:MAG: type II toxin-antitoxin system RnlA family toxin [Halanaerobiales bacterium]|nr:type II toxin-antitoxin system RnlA family toxin [Halanaerobiales bacterium]
MIIINLIFAPNCRPYVLKSHYKTKIGCTKTIKYIEDGYNFYNTYRHGLFHWADPSQPPDQTRLIENIEEAKRLIIGTLRIIDSYYILP